MSNDRVETIQARLTEEGKKVTNRAALVMRDEVIKALVSFCEQSEQFAECLHDTEKTFADCMKKVAANPGTGISDAEAYRRAVKFYMPDADVECTMTIKTAAANIIKLDFLELL